METQESVEPQSLATDSLKPNRVRHSFVDKLIRQVFYLLSPSAVTNNLIAMAIAVFALYLLHTGIVFKDSQHLVHYLTIGILIAACIQLIHASKRNLLLPVLFIAVGFYFSHTLGHGQSFLTYDAQFYQYMMLAGIFGIGISVMNLQ